MLKTEEVSNFSPAMAVPMTVKMPEPMTAPMPSAVSDTGPSVFLQRVLGFLRVGDELVDGFGAKNLAWQSPAPRSVGMTRSVSGDLAGQAIAIRRDAASSETRVRA